MNVRYRVELSQAERDRTHGAAERRQARGAQAQAGADLAGRRCRRQRRRDRQRASASAARPCTGPSAASCVGNLEAALSEEPRPGASRKLTGKEEALLVATACSKPAARAAPVGRWSCWPANWSGSPSTTASRARPCAGGLAENDLKPWRKDMWCIPQVDGEYVARMEDVLDLYAEAPDPKRPVVCFDESPTQLIGEVRQPIPAAPGQLERYDCEYRRNGTANLFVFLDVHRPWRKVKVTDSRTAVDFAHCMRELVDVHLSRKPSGSGSSWTICRPIPPARSTRPSRRREARRVLRRLEFHYTPKHASWLNMVEIEIGVLRGQCLDRRIGHQRAARRRNRRLGTTAQCLRRPHQMDVHNRKSPRQNGPRLPSTARPDQRVIITVQRY